MRFRSIAFALLSVISAAFVPAVAQTLPSAKLFINTGPDPFNRYSHLRFGGRDWDDITLLLNQSFAITKGAALPSLSQLTQYDALWIDQRYAVAPTATDISTLLGFAATGKRVVVVGENSSSVDLNFFMWSAPLIQALGGSQVVVPNAFDGPGCLYGTVNTILANQLTAGVRSIGLGCAGYALGGTALFSYNVATLWGPMQNVLTVLDANAFDDDYPVGNDGRKFESNIMTWLQTATTVVPEPSTFLMLMPGALGLFALSRLRRLPQTNTEESAGCREKSAYS